MRRFAIAFALLISACADHAKPSVVMYEHGDYAGAAKSADDGLAQFPGDDALWAMRVRSALALGDGDAVAKAYAADVKARGGDDKELIAGLANATLAQALASSSVKLKIAAIGVVEQLELQPLADAVERAMADRDDRVVAAAATAVLHGAPDAPRAASDMLKSDSPEARAIAVAGIAKKVGAIAAGDLETAVNDRDARVRRAAITGLGTIRDKNAVALLAQRQSDKDAGVRAAAAQALAAIATGDLAAFAKTALADKVLEVRIGGVMLLGAAAQTDAAQAEALKALVEDPEPLVALEAVYELEQVGAPMRKRHGTWQRGFIEPHTGLGGAVVQRALAAPEWETRAGTANLLDRVVGKQAAQPFAMQLAKDPDWRVRLAAARVLGHDGDVTDAVAVLEAAIAGGDASGQTEAAGDLAELTGDASALAKLGALVRDPSRTPDQRAAAARAFRAARRVSPELLAALADSDAFVRLEAASAIAAFAHDPKSAD